MSNQGTGKTLWALDCPEHPDSPWPHRLFGESCNGGKREATSSEIIEVARNLPGAEELMEVTETNAPVLIDGRYLKPGRYLVIPLDQAVADARRTEEER